MILRIYQNKFVTTWHLCSPQEDTFMNFIFPKVTFNSEPGFKLAVEQNIPNFLLNSTVLF